MRFWRWLILAAAATVAGPASAVEPLICKPEIAHTAPPVNACLGSETVTIAAVGDVLLHRPLQARGYGQPDGFRGIWRQAELFLNLADIAYANLEGPVAPGITRGFSQVTDPGPVFDNRVYSSFPMFNYHPKVIADLKASGFDIVSTANNHAMDRGSRGADLTIEALTAAGMPYTGTIRAGAPRDFAAYTETKLGRVAWVACSFSTNGVSDPQAQVLLCFRDQDALLSLVAGLARRSDIAAVIVTPHWGNEYSQTEHVSQRALGAALIAAGATAVLGAHPHVVQPWAWHPDPAGASGLVVYSTGNFVSGQVTLPRRTGLMALVELCRAAPARNLATALKKRLVVARAGWMPMVMVRSPAGPELVLAPEGSEGLLGQARDLVSRILPPGQLAPRLNCRNGGKLVALQ